MISKAAKAAYDRARYLRLGPREQHRDKARKSEYDRARYAARKNDPAFTQQRREYSARRWIEVLKPRWISKATGERVPVVLPAPYTGHQWLEMARAAVGSPVIIDGTERTDRYYDDMGEALLALMEGRDPVAAVREYRKLEYIPRHLTKHIGDWAGDDPDYAQELWERALPASPSAEDVAVEREERHVAIHWGQGKGLMGTPRQQQPSRRRAAA